MRSQHSGWYSQSKLIKIFISKTNDPKPFWRQQNVSTTFQSHNCNLMKIYVSDNVAVASYLAVYYNNLLFKCRWWSCKLLRMHWITNNSNNSLILEKSLTNLTQYLKIINNEWYLLLRTIYCLSYITMSFCMPNA